MAAAQVLSSEGGKSVPWKLESLQVVPLKSQALKN